MIKVVIGIGSNCGDRKAKVEEGLEWLKSQLMQTKSSTIYETPCALKAGKPYMNSVIFGYFSGDAFQLENLLKEKEESMGRDSECRKRGDVPIDMDIVICDNEIYKEWDYRQKFFRIGYEMLTQED